MVSPKSEISHASAELRALNSTFATVAVDPDGIILRANNRLLRLLGYDDEDIVGLPLATLFCDGGVPDDDYARCWTTLLRGETQTVQRRGIHKTGAEVWIEAKFTPLTDAEGRLTEIVVIATDISAQQLCRAESLGQIAAIDVSQAVIAFALDGTILHANKLFLDAMGYRLDEIVGRHHRILVDPQEAEDTAYAAFWSHLSEGTYRAGAFKRLAKDGREVWLQATYNPILDMNGRPFKIVKYATDVTDETLRQADYQWQISAIHTSHCVITFDMHGTVLTANAHFLAATGYRLDEIEGRSHRMFVDPSYAHGAEYAAFWRSLAQGRHQGGQYRRLGKGGREIWLQATYNPIFDMNGRATKVVKYATVVTEDKLRQAEHQGQVAAIHKAQCVVAFDLDGFIIDANDNMLDVFGYRLGDVRGRHHRMFVEPCEAEAESYGKFWSELTQGRLQAGEYKRIGRDGREIWLQATYNPIFDMSGRPIKVMKYATDITRAKSRQADHEGQVAAIHRSQGVVALALDGTILDANENILTALGYRLDEVKGRHHRMLVQPDQAETRAYAEFWKTLREGAFLSGLYKRIGKDGRAVWLQATYTPILDLNGRPYKVVKFATDVTSNVAMADAFEDATRQAQHDAATSLPNRVRLASFMAAALDRPGARLVVLYLDLDRFKPINDRFGHHVGDRVLGETADRLRRCLEKDQIVARVGGDEFVVAAPDLPDHLIEPFCLRLIAAASAPIQHDGNALTIGVSIGIAVSPADGTSPDELLRHADAALYRSKQNGRGGYSFFATEMNDRIVASRNLTEDMRRGIAREEFFLEYQPRVDTRKRGIKSVEALVRWSHPERGRINPADFIPLAERSGLIVPLGAWVLHTACAAASAWPGIGVSVNVSAIQFRDGNLVGTVADALAAAGLDAGRLEIELTEGVLLEDAERARTILEGLKALGVRLAIDDFGTGYSSLSYLRNFPFDVIKIDRRFIADIETLQSGRAIVQAILGLGKALGMTVTAEGVETAGQLALLTLDQCPEVQGYLMARPMGGQNVAALLAEERAIDSSGSIAADDEASPHDLSAAIMQASCALA